MNPMEIKIIMENRLGIDFIKLAELLDLPPAHIELMLSGKMIPTGEIVIKIFELETTCSIPRVHMEVVKNIITNGKVLLTGKAKAIHDIDYDLALRATSKPLRRTSLISIGTIKEHLQNRIDKGVDK